MFSKGIFCLLTLIFSRAVSATCLPSDFIELKKIDPTIIQEIRYAGYHNFIGRPIQGYDAPSCFLTRPAAEALRQVQKKLLAHGMSLKVYDCYRPQMAVDDFISWSQQADQHQMKAEFYPRVDKADFFKLGYVAAKSGHTRGSTVDLTIVKLPVTPNEDYKAGQRLVACYAPLSQRFADNSIDMGTGFDCLDQAAHDDSQTISSTAYRHRRLLKTLMMQQGFLPYSKEWWHFTLKNEPYRDRYFNCTVQ